MARQLSAEIVPFVAAIQQVEDEELPPSQEDMLVPSGFSTHGHYDNLVNPRCLMVGCGVLAAAAGVGLGVASLARTQRSSNVGDSVVSYDEDRKPLTIASIGHVDSGKSTLLGHLMHLNGDVSSDTIDKFEADAKKVGKGSFKYAWLFDNQKEERERGITIMTAIRNSTTTNYDVTFLDNPGHRDFIEQVTNHMPLADVAILNVASSTGEFEAGISKNGQTREHALAAYTLGVKRVIVAISKMDNTEPPYSEARYKEIKKEVESYLKKVGFNPKKVAFIPVSGFHGDNLKTVSTNMPWFEGAEVEINTTDKATFKTLDDAINGVSAPERSVDKDLRIGTCRVFHKSGGEQMIIPCGKIFDGKLDVGMKVCFSGGTSVIESTVKKIIKSNGTTADSAVAGDFVTFQVDGSSTDGIKRGMIVSGAEEKLPARIESMEAQVIVLNHPGEIHAGYSPVVDICGQSVKLTLKELKQKIDRRSGKLLETNPDMIKSGDAAMVTLVPAWELNVPDGTPLFAESFNDRPYEGRFSMRDMRQIVAVGVVKSVKFK